MDYLYLAPLGIVLYMVAVDPNLADYLYLRLFAEPVLWIRTTTFRYRLLLSLRYDTFLLKRGVVPRKFYDMANDLRNQSSESK